MAKQFVFSVEIEMHFDCTWKQATEKLKSWLEANGHTSAGHGFNFKTLQNLVKRRE
jgi:hypothetical protein